MPDIHKERIVWMFSINLNTGDGDGTHLGVAPNLKNSRTPGPIDSKFEIRFI